VGTWLTDVLHEGLCRTLAEIAGTEAEVRSAEHVERADQSPSTGGLSWAECHPDGIMSLADSGLIGICLEGHGSRKVGLILVPLRNL